MKKKYSFTDGVFSPRIFLAFNLFCVAALLAAAAFNGITRQADECPAGTNCADRKADTEEPARYMPVPGEKAEDIGRIEQYWSDRLTYPTGQFDPAWVRRAIADDAAIARAVPAGMRPSLSSNSPLVLDVNSFTALGPAPGRMTGCSGCYDYGVTAGRVNAIAVDPTTTTTGSITAYIATVDGGVWKTTNCCNSSTTWTSTMDDALVSTTSVDTIAIDPNDHNTIYVGTGDQNYGSFSMGSQGILKSTNGGASWVVLGSDVFGALFPTPLGAVAQYQAIGKVRVDPNNSNNIVAGTKTGLYFSYNAGQNWTGPCTTNNFNTQRQDITGLELTNIGGTTRIVAAVATRGFATTVQIGLDQNGANGIYRGTMPASGCPSDFTLVSRNDNGFVFGTQVAGSPYTTGQALNAGSGTPYASLGNGNQLGRIDIAVAPSNSNYIYAQVTSIAPNSASGCGNAAGCQLGVWSSINGGDSWTFMTGSAGGSLARCTSTAGSGDYPQNWYDQGLVVDQNNPDRIFVDTYDTWLATRGGLTFYNLTCGYDGTSLSGHVVHVDQHALAFVPGSSSLLLKGSDGGIFSSPNADAAVAGVLRNTWVNMDTGLNTIEFYSGDISGNFATAASPQANGGAQDNGSYSVTFAGSPTGPMQWQMGKGGDGFTARIDPVGTGTNLRFWQGNNSGTLSRCVSNCTASGASWTTRTGGWTGDTQSFILPYDLFHGGIPGGDDCGPAGATTGCGNLIAGTTRVWETITGAAVTTTWAVTNNPSNQNMTKQALGNRSFINQVKYSPKFKSVAIVGTSDGNAWIGFNLGTGVANAGNWVNVTGTNAVLPNRSINGIALDPTVATADAPIGYAALGGFDDTTPATPGHLFRVACQTNCSSFVWQNKSGNLPNIPVDSVIVNPNYPQQVFAGTDIGLYYTDDITAATPVWYRFNSGLPNVMIWDMQIDRGSTTLSLWTRGRGAFVWPLPSGPIGSPPTPTPTATATATPTATATATSTPTVTPTATATATPVISPTPTATATATATATPTSTPTVTPTATASATATATATPVTSPTPTATATATATPTATPTATATATSTPTATATATPTATATATATATVAPTATATATATPTATASATVAPTATSTATATATPTATATSTPTATATATATSTPTATPTATPAAQAVNLSTRMRVDTGDSAGIGGFIITGNVPKRVVVRALGPSLTGFGFPAAALLADPVVEIHGPGNFGTVTNNNWKDTQQAQIQADGLAPTNDLESAIDATLPPGNYSAVVRGNAGTPQAGIALVEVYDINTSAASKLANLSTRAFVGTGSNVVIAGFILGNQPGNDRIVIRGIGPSLSAFGVANPLQDPTLELRDQNGTLLRSDNDWQDDAAQATEITAAGLAPSNPKESAIAATLPPGPYTAILAGLNNGTGVGLVEVYDRGGGP